MRTPSTCEQIHYENTFYNGKGGAGDGRDVLQRFLSASTFYLASLTTLSICQHILSGVSSTGEHILYEKTYYTRTHSICEHILCDSAFYLTPHARRCMPAAVKYVCERILSHTTCKQVRVMNRAGDSPGQFGGGVYSMSGEI